MGGVPIVATTAAVGVPAVGPTITYAAGLQCLLNPVCATMAGAGSASSGFEKFRELQNRLRNPGKGKIWHHIVEQSQMKKSGFLPQQIHNVNNVIAVDQNIHYQVSGYYSSIRAFTDGLRVRDWLAGQSFSDQINFGLQVLRDFGVLK